MDVYAEGLTHALKPFMDNRLQLKAFTPKASGLLTSLLEKSNMQMRIERYLSYPLHARRQQSAVNHVLDHAYGHLLACIDPKRTIISVHDMIPLLAYNNKIPGVSYSHLPVLFKFSLSFLNKARFVVAVSNSTKNDLINYCGLKEERIKVIYNGVDSRFVSFPDKLKEEKRKSFGFPGEHAFIILITGSLTYKNHETSLKAIEILQKKVNKQIQLVILKGASNDLQTDPAKYEFINQPVILSGLDHNRLVDLYNSVDCLLFPSFYEGFGWPPLEAMACGTPVVASNAASLPEIVGNAGIMESPYEPNKFAEAISALLESPETRNIYIGRGLNRVKQFTWESCAGKFNTLYEDVLDNVD